MATHPPNHNLRILISRSSQNRAPFSLEATASSLRFPHLLVAIEIPDPSVLTYLRDEVKESKPRLSLGFRSARKFWICGGQLIQFIKSETIPHGGELAIRLHGCDDETRVNLEKYIQPE